MQQLREFAEHKTEFDQAGARIVAVSVDDREHARLVFDKQIGGKFPILSDLTLSAIRAYGLVHTQGHAGGDIAIRATLVIDKDGVERWRRVSESVPDIPKSAEVLEQLRALK
jgi:peroxiredoxin